jgi:hypothetical protein
MRVTPAATVRGTSTPIRLAALVPPAARVTVFFAADLFAADLFAAVFFVVVVDRDFVGIGAP